MLKLGVLLPTNNPLEWGTCLGPSLANLTALTSFAQVKFLYHFQGPWSKAMIAAAVKTTEAAGFDAPYVVSPQRPYSAYVLRQKAALLWPEADLYMLCDDNVIFVAHGTPQYPRNSAERYVQVLDYFATFKSCGVVTCEGSLGGSIQRESIYPTTSALMATARGMFFRNLHHGEIHTEEQLQFKGGLGESVLAYGLMSQGYYIAKSMNHPTKHVHLTKVKDKKNGALINDVMLHADGLKYVRERWQDRWWTHSSGQWPGTLVREYLEHGGDPLAIALGVSTSKRSPRYRKEYP